VSQRVAAGAHAPQRNAQTRFCTKYRQRDGALVLKVTDDVQARDKLAALSLVPRPPLSVTHFFRSRVLPDCSV
jgi:hypothetical protein